MYIPKKAKQRIVKGIKKSQKVLSIAQKRDVNESDTVSIITDIMKIYAI